MRIKYNPWRKKMKSLKKVFFCIVVCVVLLTIYMNIYHHRKHPVRPPSPTLSEDEVDATVLIYDNSTMVYTEIRPGLVFLYTAVAARYHTTIDMVYRHRTHPGRPRTVFITRVADTPIYTSIILIGWEHISQKMTVYKCCVLLINGSVIAEEQHIKIQKQILLKTKEPGYVATEFTFPLNHDYKRITHVSMTPYYETCPREDKFYLKPHFPELNYRPGLALCSKVAFHKLDSNVLVEWFEAQRYLGVSKVVAYTYQLEVKPLRVLKYYQSIGFVELIEFDYPDKERVPRKAGEEGEHWYNDETVALFDCVEKLYNYQYVAIVDKDEFIVPYQKNLQDSLPRFLDSFWKVRPKLAGVRFKTQIHNITSGPIDGNTMMAADCLTCSRPIQDRTKNIYIPKRVVPGSVTTHMLVPRPGYQWQLVHPKMATLHHYRTSRENYTNMKITIDYTETCNVMKRLADHVTASTMKIRKELGLNN